MIKIYHNPRCRKSREGLELMNASGKEFEIVYYLEEVPKREELKHLLNSLSIAPLDLIRKNEAVWKAQYKGKSLSEEEIIDAMLQHPKLIERPIVIQDNRAVIGRPIENITELLSSLE